jgi:exopolysaccharide production protein ExoQ
MSAPTPPSWPAAEPGVVPDQTSRPRVSLLESAFAWLTLYLATGGGISMLEFLLRITPPQDVQQGDPFAQRIWSAVYIVAVLLIFLRLPRVVRALPALGSLWVLLALALASITWSFGPSVTLRRSVALLGTMAVGIYLGTRYTREELFRILFWMLATITVVSLLAGMFGTGAAGGPGAAWQGVFGSKNELGHVMALSAATAATYFMDPRGRRYWATGTFLLAVALLVLSGSKGALVVLFAGLLIYPLSRLFRVRPGLTGTAALAAFAACGVVVTTLAGNSDTVLNLLGRDATLTGRTPLWALIWERIKVRPWLGYGYGGFWLQWNPPSGDIWRVSMMTGGWLPPNGHNGFIDLWADLGLAGLGAFLVSFAANVARALRLVRESASAVDLFPLLFLYLVVLSNLTESVLVTHNSLIWLLYVALSIQLGLEARASRLPPAPART